MIPGLGMAARSGGLPPSTAVERSCPRFVEGRYLALTLGYAFLKPSMTALKDSPSGPVQSARSTTLPETFSAAFRRRVLAFFIVAAARDRAGGHEEAEEQC